jgi:hypothetical protein
MTVLKEGSMACTRANSINFTNELAQRQNACAIILTEHNHQTPDVLWKPEDGEGRESFSEGDKAKFKLVTTVDRVDGKDGTGKLIWPPKFTRLSDELVYLATKFLKASERGANYPYDFNDRGDIREQRVPSGVSPIVWAHGLPFFPVFKGYYILCGREHARWVGWLLNKKEHRVTVGYPMWTIGPVVAPGSAVSLPRTVTRQMHLHVPKSAKDVERKWEKVDTARDVVCTAHYLMSVVPKTPSKGFILAPIYQVDGYHVRCGPNTLAGGKGVEIGRRTLSTHGVYDFDYDASLKRPYVNEENPAAIHSDDSSDTEEEDSEATEPMSGMDEDEDGRDDGSFVLSSEESAEAGEIVEEHPRKKLKKDVAASDKTESQPETSDLGVKSSKNFKATNAADRVTSLTSFLSDQETHELSGSPSSSLAVECNSEATTTITVKHVADTKNTPNAVLTEAVYQDAATQTTAVSSSSHVLSSTADINNAPSDKTTTHANDTTEAPTTHPINKHATHHAETIHIHTATETETETKTLNEYEDDEAFRGAQNTQLSAYPAPLSPREVSQEPEKDILQD